MKAPTLVVAIFQISRALSPRFVSEWGPAFDVESIVFRSHGCVQSKPLPADAKRTYHDFGYLPESEMVLLKQPFV